MNATYVYHIIFSNIKGLALKDCRRDGERCLAKRILGHHRRAYILSLLPSFRERHFAPRASAMPLAETPKLTPPSSSTVVRVITIDASFGVTIANERSCASPSAKRRRSGDALDALARPSSRASAGSGARLDAFTLTWELDLERESDEVVVRSSTGARARVRAPSAFAPSCAATPGDATLGERPRFACAALDGSFAISIAIECDGDLHAIDVDDVVVWAGPIGTIGRVTRLGACGNRALVFGGGDGRGAVVDAHTLRVMCELKENTLSRVLSGIRGEEKQAIVDVGARAARCGGKELVTLLRADGFVQVWDVTAVIAIGNVGKVGKATRACAGFLPAAPGSANVAPERLALAMAAAPSANGHYLNIVVSSRVANSQENARFSAPGDATLALYAVKHGSLVYVSSIEGSKGVTRALAITEDVVLAARELADGEDADVVDVLCWPLNALHRAREVSSGDVEATALADWGHCGRGNGAAAELLARFGRLNGYTPSSVAKALTEEIGVRGLVSEYALEFARAAIGVLDENAADASARDVLIAAAGGTAASTSDVVRAWCKMAPEYARGWRQAHAPLAFIGDSPTLLMRAGGLLSALRANSDVEESVARAKITNEDSPMLKFNVKGKQAVAALTALFMRLNSVLGTSACSAMDLIASGLAADTSSESKSSAFDARDEDIDARSQTSQDWLESFAGALTGDVFASIDSGESESKVKSRRASHRAKQRLIIRLLQDALSNIPDPEHALRACMDFLVMQPSDASGVIKGADDVDRARGESVAETAVLNSARQQVRVRVAVSRGLILLLGCIRLGPKVGFPNAAMDFVSDILPRAMNVYRSMIFASWLLTAPRKSTEISGAETPRLAVVLANLRDLTAASETMTSEEIQSAGQSLGAHIVAGENANDSEARRVVEIGTTLYAAGEVDALGTLLAFARHQVPGSEFTMPSDAPALLFLQALWVCADLAGFNDAEDAERRARSVDSAVSLFSRSAAFIPETSHSATAAAQKISVDALLVQLLRVIRSILIGCDDPAEEVYPGDIVTRLEYYEIVMLFFERLGCAAGASAAAYAALHEVVDDENQSARLWANVLQYAVDARDWRGAYCAATSTMGDHRQAAAMRRLVAAVCAKGAKNGGAVLSTLCLDDNDRQHYNTVANALEGRAATSPIDSSPAPSEILYGFYLSRGEPAKAAVAMHKFAERLRALVQEVAQKPVVECDKLVEALSRHASALLSAANALAILSDVCSVSFDNQAGDFDADMEGNDDMGAVNVVSSGLDTKKSPLALVLREYALSAARLELLHAGGDISSLGFGAKDDDPAMISALSESLIEFGCFSAATTLCTAWLDGERLTSALVIISGTMAAFASMRQIGDPSEIVHESIESKRRSAYNINNSATSGLIGVESSSKSAETYWKELRAFVERFDTLERNFALADASARAILSVDARIALPMWLKQRFINPASLTTGSGMARRSANPTALLRIYLAFDLNEDAAQLALKELIAWSKRSAVDRTAHLACWFPMDLIVESRYRCAKDHALSELGAALQAAIDAHDARVKSDSAMLLRAAA